VTCSCSSLLDTLERVKALLVCQETATASEGGRVCRAVDPMPVSGRSGSGSVRAKR
jgi:hypothetical protein